MINPVHTPTEALYPDPPMQTDIPQEPYSRLTGSETTEVLSDNDQNTDIDQHFLVPPLSIVSPSSPPKPTKKIVTLASLTALVVLTITALVFFFVLSGYKPNSVSSNDPVEDNTNLVSESVYGISIAGQTEIVLSNEEDAQAVLDELTEYYTNIAAANANIIVTSVTYEEDVQIVEIAAQSSDMESEIEIMSKQEALQTLINGKNQSVIEYTVAEEVETVQEIAQKQNVTWTSIVDENNGLTFESQLKQGTRIKLVIIEPYLHVVTKGTYEFIEEINFETETKEDANILINKKEVMKKGTKGSKEITYSYVSSNGIITKIEIIKETITKKPENEIILIGIKYAGIPDAIADLPKQNAVNYLWQNLDGLWKNEKSTIMDYMDFSKYQPGTMINYSINNINVHWNLIGARKDSANEYCAYIDFLNKNQGNVGQFHIDFKDISNKKIRIRSYNKKNEHWNAWVEYTR
jgi:hypothetical protein